MTRGQRVNTVFVFLLTGEITCSTAGTFYRRSQSGLARPSIIGVTMTRRVIFAGGNKLKRFKNKNFYYYGHFLICKSK